ncbi:MAG: twin-arginine translocase subunit TatC [Halobacteriota archaeon]|nr:twin-arginine translocase subunit TatC [Halobacteriota archaeon]
MEELTTIAEGLRKRMIPIGVVIVVGILVTFPLLNRVIRRISDDLLPKGMDLIQLEPLELILLEIKIAVVCGILAATPLILYYLVKVVNERIRPVDFNIKRGNMILIAFFAVLLFVVGASYSYFLMLPFFFNYVYQMALGAGVISNWSIAPFINFVVLMTAVFGIVFELPLILTLLVRGGVVELDTLKKYRRHAYVGLLILAALITSPDIFTQAIIGGPLILFYEVSIFVARFASVEEPEYDRIKIGDCAFKNGLILGAGMILGPLIVALLTFLGESQYSPDLINGTIPPVGQFSTVQMIMLPLIIPMITGLFVSYRTRKMSEVFESEYNRLGKGLSTVAMIAILVAAVLWVLISMNILFTINNPMNIMAMGIIQPYPYLIILLTGFGTATLFISMLANSYNGSNRAGVMIGLVISAIIFIVLFWPSVQFTLTPVMAGFTVAGVVSTICGYIAKLSFLKE